MSCRVLYLYDLLSVIPRTLRPGLTQLQAIINASDLENSVRTVLHWTRLRSAPQLHFPADMLEESELVSLRVGLSNPPIAYFAAFGNANHTVDSGRTTSGYRSVCNGLRQCGCRAAVAGGWWAYRAANGRS